MGFAIDHYPRRIIIQEEYCKCIPQQYLA